MVNSFKAAALNGQIASTVAMVNMDLSVAHFKGLSLHLVFMLIPMIHNHNRDVHGKILNTLTQIAEAGNLRPVLDEQNFTLSEAGQAHERLSSSQAMGKVFLEI